MPIPTPNEGEAQRDFIPRCMGDRTMNSEYPERDQRAAVCFSSWRKEKGKADTDVREILGSPEPKLQAKKVEPGTPPEEDAGWIEGYLSVFNVVDLGADVVRPGAFKKTIQERVSAGKVKLMVKHAMLGGDTAEVIGTITEAKEDDYGLWVHAELSSGLMAQETRRKVAEGHVSGMSMGYRAIEWAFLDEYEGVKDVRELKEVALYEGTITAFPMNEQASITAAASMSAAPEASGEANGEASPEDDPDRDHAEEPDQAHQERAGRPYLAEIDAKQRWLELQKLQLLEGKAFRHNSSVADSEPAWGRVDNRKLPRLAFADMGEADKVSTWRYPHHWVQNGGGTDEKGRFTTGTMYLHEGGLNAAWAAAHGARSGQRASASVISHLQTHRSALGTD